MTLPDEVQELILLAESKGWKVRHGFGNDINFNKDGRLMTLILVPRKLDFSGTGVYSLSISSGMVTVEVQNQHLHWLRKFVNRNEWTIKL